MTRDPDRDDAPQESAGPSAPLDDADPSTQTADETEPVECPYCGSTNTERDHPQGPSACRSMHSCLDCGQPFEKFG